MNPSSDLPGDLVHTAHFYHDPCSGNCLKNSRLHFSVLSRMDE